MRMLGILIALLLIVSGINCGWNQFHYVRQRYYPAVPGKVIPVYIDTEFGEGDRMEIQEAVDQWNYALNNYIVLRVEEVGKNEVVDKAESGGIAIMKIRGEDLKWFSKELWDHEEEVDGKKIWIWTLGFTNRIGGDLIYLVRDRLGKGMVRAVAMHEIGHALGSGHRADGLMTPLYGGGWECVDKGSAEAVANYWGLPMEKMNWCYLGNDPLR